MIWMDVDIALASVPVNAMPLIDSTDFKTIEDAVVFNQAGLALFWHFTTTAGVTTSTAVTPTSGGDYDWTDQGTSGMYAIEIPASGGASANNNTEGFGWFTGVATGILPWAGPIIGFRAAGLNNALVDSAYSATRGLAGTAVPDAAADAAGGVPISDAGGLDLDAKIGALAFTVAGTVDANTTHLAGGSTAADNLRRSAESIYYGTVDSGTTTTIVDDQLTQSGTDHWKGRIVIFLTGTLAKQATDITAFTPASDELTVSTLTAAPQAGDTYVIV